MKKKDIFILAGGIVVLVLIIFITFLALYQPVQTEEVNVITDKKEYKVGDVLKVKIKNNLKRNICFSSCYPYYFEKKNEEWESYHYLNCQDSNLIEDCVDSEQVKAFELIIPSMEIGLHRLVIPSCIGCNIQEMFKEKRWFYSNEFIIK